MRHPSQFRESLHSSRRSSPLYIDRIRWVDSFMWLKWNTDSSQVRWCNIFPFLRNAWSGLHFNGIAIDLSLSGIPTYGVGEIFGWMASKRAQFGCIDVPQSYSIFTKIGLWDGSSFHGEGTMRLYDDIMDIVLLTYCMVWLMKPYESFFQSIE